MPWIIDYQIVVEQMKRQGYRSLYYNSGAFGFADAHAVKAVGWIGADDPTLRPQARAVARPVPAPYEPTLASLATTAWQCHAPGRAWVLPMSHWAYELDFGSATWMPPALEQIGIDPGMLQTRNTGDAIEFTPDQGEHFARFVQRLLEGLTTSDFAIAFPNHPLLCTIHHHKQLWWMTTDPAVAASLDALAAG